MGARKGGGRRSPLRWQLGVCHQRPGWAEGARRLDHGTGPRGPRGPEDSARPSLPLLARLWWNRPSSVLLPKLSLPPAPGSLGPGRTCSGGRPHEGARELSTCGLGGRGAAGGPPGPPGSQTRWVPGKPRPSGERPLRGKHNRPLTRFC